MDMSQPQEYIAVPVQEIEKLDRTLPESQWVRSIDSQPGVVRFRATEAEIGRLRVEPRVLRDERRERGTHARQEGLAQYSVNKTLESLDLEKYAHDAALEIERTMRRSEETVNAPVSESMLDFLARSSKTVPEVYQGWENADSEERKRMVAAASEEGLRDRLSAARKRAVELLMFSMSQAEVAAMLGVDKSNVSRMGRDDRLYVFTVGDRKRYPWWQFDGSGTVPGLRVVVACFNDSGLDPLSVGRFMVLKRDDLDGLSPAEYLALGGDPSRIVGLVEGWLHR